MLDAIAPGADGTRTVRYVNPLTGGSVMPTLDCFAVRLGRACGYTSATPKELGT